MLLKNEVKTKDKKLTTTYPFTILYALFFIKHLNIVNTH